ncbi:MAG: SpoIIE family protein phosphatase [Ruminiclostridium sp.]|nr:SpoIIE family protein phosphatase [Ruminiclostridium sp.]
MATKEKTGDKQLFYPRGDSVRLSRRAFLRTAETAVGFLLGGILAGAELFGLYTPFGVAAVAASGSGFTGFSTLAGACLGYLCLEGLTDGMRYAAAAILTYSVAFAFYDTRIYRQGWFMPTIAALLSAATGIVCRAGEGWYGEDLVFFVTEVVLTGGAAWCYAILFDQWPQTLEGLNHLTPKQGAGVLMLSGTILMALGRVEILESFSMGRLLAGVCILLAARRGVGEGVLVGACGGVALDLAAGDDPVCSMIYTLAGLACGLCWARRKAVAGGVYVLAVVVGALWTWDGGLRLGLPVEALLGALLFLFLPWGREKPQERGKGVLALTSGELEPLRQTVSRRMEEMAGAFHSLSDSVKETLSPQAVNPQDPSEIFTRTADRVCLKCVLRGNCWQKDYEDTRGACNDATRPMLDRGRALATDFAGHFSSRCIRFPEFLGEVNRQLTAYLRRRQALRRTWETRQALCSQYERLDQFMARAATQLSAELTPDLPRQDKLNAFLRSMNLGPGLVYYDQVGRLRAETPYAEELGTKPVRRQLGEILGTPLREGEVQNGRMVFLQAETFRASAAIAGAARTGEGVSGDTGNWFRREDGLLFLLLCDGMGSGYGAKEESAQGVRLLESFLRAGMDPDQAVETVSSTLALRGDTGASTTIDLLSVDLYTGRCRMLKQGAAPTYIRRGDKIRVAGGTSLPAGLVTGAAARPDSHSLRGEAGDWIILLTDGILCGREDGWLQELLLGYRGVEPGELAGKVLGASQDLWEGEDDATVIALRLEENLL